MLAMAASWLAYLLVVYISISAVTAAYGSAFTAGYLEKRNAARPVGASLLAMEVNDDAGSLTPRGALRFFASRLAPTESAAIGLSMGRAPRGELTLDLVVWWCTRSYR
ncbi:hypothetical protein CD175_00765 [Pseudomonas laurylsulfatiphila]|uniref:Uncharacterized protein n=1 Tax=Pseudomonas laurylsulfatiphila TaxID=2011015 RepID=A0A2S6FRH3_9PSED|nr:hypothetical protein CD175_00765 [Pseudomonas laurylsulfatiphila]